MPDEDLKLRNQTIRRRKNTGKGGVRGGCISFGPEFEGNGK